MAGLTDPKTGQVIPGSSTTNTSTTPTSGTTTVPTSQFNSLLSAAQGGAGNIYANMKTYTNTGYVTQTSPQDIESLINATMQSLVGRNATAQEIQTYGSELLAAEKANMGSFQGVTAYGPTGKRADVTGTQTTTGVDVQGFLQSLISGSADAQSYKAATGYFDAMTQALQQQKAI